MHPNAQVVEGFYAAQRRFCAGEDTAETLRGLLCEDVAWHVPGRSPVDGHYRGHNEVLTYFAERHARTAATFQIEPRGSPTPRGRSLRQRPGRARR